MPKTPSDTAVPEKVDQPVYRVLARKYRPQCFGELIGQDALVRTLQNAITSGRIAHAYILTGVRGVGKTTTARIFARALNCTGDGATAPVAEPCGRCDTCRAIAEDRHVDVIEMDAASRTGVGDIRELIEGVRYRPVSARHKVYIIDEVHMLSNQAFNALLKTLEEPPESVIFVFATTEIRKVPMTVLSRCQRFDLLRVDETRLVAHFKSVLEKEAVKADDDAINLIARGADGSVRDGLSLLDQAIALAQDQTITALAVRDMLGLADQARTLDLLDALFDARLGQALGIFDKLVAAGGDPVTLLGDLLDWVHDLTRRKLVPGHSASLTVTSEQRQRLDDMVKELGLPYLARAWQILLKGYGEAKLAPDSAQAASMTLIRLGHAAGLPDPAALIKKLDADGEGQTAPSSTGGSGPGAGQSRAQGVSHRGAVSAQSLSPQPQGQAQEKPQLHSFADVVALARSQREMQLAEHLARDVRVVHFEAGRIEVAVEEAAPRDLVNRLSRLLSDWTGTRWMVLVSGGEAKGQETVKEQRDKARQAKLEEARANPLVKAAMEVFPKAEIVAVRKTGAGSQASGEETSEGND